MTLILGYTPRSIIKGHHISSLLSSDSEKNNTYVYIERKRTMIKCDKHLTNLREGYIGILCTLFTTFLLSMKLF